MDKRKLFDRSKNTAVKVLKIRRALKIFFAFGSGISTAMVSFRVLYPITENRFISVYYAVLAGAATTAIALLFMEIIRRLIGLLKKLGLSLLVKYKNKGRNNNGKQQDIRSGRDRI